MTSTATSTSTDTATAQRGGDHAPTLVSINVGMPTDVSWHGRTVHTGAWKHPVSGPRMVRRLNIDGDGQGDLNGHGGEQRAVLVYQVASYRYWRQHFDRNDFSYGQFGENLTVAGLPDDEVCIGDRYRIGEAEFEVTQPRVTCYRVGLRADEPELPALLVSHHRPGFYMRVITEGHIQAGQEIIKTRTGPHALTVADTDALLYLPNRNTAQLRAATDIPAMSPGWRESFRTLLATQNGARAASGGPASAEPAWPGFRPLRVATVQRETPAVSSIYLTAPDGGPLPTAKAGQYLTLRIPDAGQPAPVRSYSLSAAPGTDSYRISVKREPHGTVSGYLTERLRAGATLDVAAPRGDFVLSQATGPILFLSAGIGITPVLSMLHSLAAEGSDRELWWLHGARGPHEQALTAEAHALLEHLPHAHEQLFWSRATAAECRRGHATRGRITGAVLRMLGLPADAHAYLCGPASFLTDIRRSLTLIGLDNDHIHSELFGTLPSINPGLTAHTAVAPHQPSAPATTGPLVTFARSGIATRFGASAGSVLDLADACDVPTRWSCRTGVCHTCVTALLSGTITYSPNPLDTPPPDEVLICCARPSTDIVVDM
jgi:ferredoxin-NADP reductase/MOSC domain-containing protein YiiM